MKKTFTLIALFALFIMIGLSCSLDTEIEQFDTSSDNMVRCETKHVVGGYWISPKQKTKNAGDKVKTKLRVNCGDYHIGAISIQISYNPQVITPNLSIGDKGLVTEVFLKKFYAGFAVNILPISATESMLFISAFHAMGVTPSPEAVLFDINWIGVAPGVTKLTPNVLMSVDARDYSTVGTPIGYPAIVTIK